MPQRSVSPTSSEGRQPVQRRDCSRRPAVIRARSIACCTCLRRPACSKKFPDRQLQTDADRCLPSDRTAPTSRSAWARYVGRPYVWQSWGDLMHSVKTGKSAFGHLHSRKSLGVAIETRQDETAIFDAAMSELSRAAGAGDSFGLRFRQIRYHCRRRRRPGRTARGHSGEVRPAHDRHPLRPSACRCRCAAPAADSRRCRSL